MTTSEQIQASLKRSKYKYSSRFVKNFKSEFLRSVVMNDYKEIL